MGPPEARRRMRRTARRAARQVDRLSVAPYCCDHVIGPEGGIALCLSRAVACLSRAGAMDEEISDS